MRNAGVNAHKAANPRNLCRPSHGDRLLDEVCRHMYRLEESRPGAELELAVALLRAWLDAASRSDGGERVAWLKGVCPICLQMIQAASRGGDGESLRRPVVEEQNTPLKAE